MILIYVEHFFHFRWRMDGRARASVHEHPRRNVCDEEKSEKFPDTSLHDFFRTLIPKLGIIGP